MTLSWLLMAAHVPPDGQRGGMVRYVAEVGKALAAHPDVELSVVAGRGAEAFWEPVVGSPARVYPMAAAPTAGQGWLERRGLGSPAFKRTFDVVHGAKHLLPRKAKGLGLLTIHDFLPLDRPGDFTVLKRHLLPHPYLESIAQAQALVCVSNATRDRLLSYAPSAGPRSHVVPLAGSTLRHVVPESVQRIAGKRFALVVGDASARKNLDFVIDIWPEVVARVPGATLVIVGPPAWKQDLSVTGLDSGVMPLGFLSDAQLAWCYRQAQVVLCPSVLEGFGLPAREAVELGAPLITSEDPALCEVSGDAGVHAYANDPQAWVAAIVIMLQTGRPHVELPAHPRTWGDVANETVEVARNALGA